MSGVKGVIGFLFGTLLPLFIWKTFGYNHWSIPFLCSPIFAFVGTVIMVGYVGFKDRLSAQDDRGNAILSAFWSVLALLQLIGALICLGVVLE
jgi:hypothetical protein